VFSFFLPVFFAPKKNNKTSQKYLQGASRGVASVQSKPNKVELVTSLLLLVVWMVRIMVCRVVVADVSLILLGWVGVWVSAVAARRCARLICNLVGAC